MDKCRKVYGQWGMVHGFESELYAMVTLSSAIPSDLYI